MQIDKPEVKALFRNYVRFISGNLGSAGVYCFFYLVVYRIDAPVFKSRLV